MELTGGLWFVLRPRSRALAPVLVYLAVTLTFTMVSVQALARGIDVANCGCFGLYLSQRLSLFVLAQDALLLLYGALLVRDWARSRAERLTTVAARRRGTGLTHDAPGSIAPTAEADQELRPSTVVTAGSARCSSTRDGPA